MAIVRRSALSALAFAVVVACGGADDPDAAAETSASAGATTPTRSVEILSPASGDTVQGPSVVVRLQANGFTVVAAGDTTPNSGHHHLFLDRDVSEAGLPIPIEPGFIVHLGTGTAEYTLENVPPGEHRLIAVVGDAAHIPLQPLVVDTVRFVVR